MAGGEDPDGVGTAADLAVESCRGVVGPDLSPHFPGELGERQNVGSSSVEVVVDLGQRAGDVVEQPVELGVHRGPVGLVVDAVHHRLDRRPHALRGQAHQVR